MSDPNPVLLCGSGSNEILKENMVISVDFPMFDITISLDSDIIK